jgi:hypothetical protein
MSPQRVMNRRAHKIGQQLPIIVVEADRFILIDGYKRVRALKPRRRLLDPRARRSPPYPRLPAISRPCRGQSVPQRALDIALNGFRANAEAPGNLYVTQPVEAVQQKCFTAGGRQFLECCSEMVNAADSIRLSLRIGARARGTDRVRLGVEPCLRTRCTAIGIRREIGGGGEENSPGLTPQVDIIAFPELEPDVLQDVLGSSGSRSPPEEAKKILPHSRKASRQPIDGCSLHLYLKFSKHRQQILVID